MSPAPAGESSFRDPAGHVYSEGGSLYRQVNHRGAADFELLQSSGLYDELVERRLLIPHELMAKNPLGESAYFAIIRPEKVPLVTYPYEWCFEQLQDAALATLDIQLAALAREMTLKDATAFNIQFYKGAPVHIDTLSFKPYRDGEPWMAYNEFCRHFLAPLLVMAYCDRRLGRVSSAFIEGLPLDLASSLLPKRTRLNPLILTHIHLQAKLTSGHEAPRKAAHVRKDGLELMIRSLRGLVAKLRPKGSSPWERYYRECTYADSDIVEKACIVETVLDRLSDIKTLCDIGANTGRFSRIASERGIRTLAIDADSAAVGKCYLEAKHSSDPFLTPLVQDLRNPSPGLGWRSRERPGLIERIRSDVVMALALVHHLSIGGNVPFPLVARLLSDIAPIAIVEFVPASDPQARRLMAFREDIFDWYTQEGFESAFENQGYSVIESRQVGETGRTLYLFAIQGP